MRCRVNGHACHSAHAPEGVNAISYAAQLISHLDELGSVFSRRQDPRFTPCGATIQVGVIAGGTALNIVPQSCWFDFEIRYLPGTRPQDVTEATAAGPKASCFRQCVRLPKVPRFVFSNLAITPVC